MDTKDAIWKHIENSVDDLNAEVAKRNKNIYTALIDLIKGLETDKEGRLLVNKHNLQLIANAKKIGLIAKKELRKPITAFVNQFDKQATLVDKHFETDAAKA